MNSQPVQLRQEHSYMNAQPTYQPQYQDNMYSDPYASDAGAYGTIPNQHQPLHELPYINPYTNQTQSYDAKPTQGSPIERHDSDYGQWMAPAAGGAAAGALLGEAHRLHQAKKEEQVPQAREPQQQQSPQVDQQGIPIDDLTGGTQAQPQYPVDDLTGGTQAQPQHEVFPSSAPAAVNEDTSGTAPAIPQPYSDHVASGPTVHPATIIANQGHRDLDKGAVTPTPNNNTSSFLDGSEAAPAATSGRTVNGGPVPFELVETAEKQAFPGVHRTYTDISVSDLHVPGEYPNVPGTPGTTAGTFLSYADRF